MRKPSAARYRTTNWSSYNVALRKRGSLLIWLDKEMAWLAPHEGRPGRPGRPPVFSDAAIQVCLSIKVLFKLPLRQTAGMVASLLQLAGLGWPVPDASTLCRRQRTLAVQIPYRRAGGPLNLLVDSTGIKFLGDGEWQVRKHGPQGRRQWRLVHLAMDPATSDIRAVEFTPSRDGDSPVLPDLLDQIPEEEPIGTVTADGAYDTRRCHAAIIEREATAIIPIRGVRAALKGGRPGGTGPKRDTARHSALRPGALETLVRISRSKPDRSDDALPQVLRGTHRRKRPGSPDRRDPHPHRPHEPLLCPRHRRDRPRGPKPAGKGEVTPRAQILQQRPSPSSVAISASASSRRRPAARRPREEGTGAGSSMATVPAASPSSRSIGP